MGRARFDRDQIIETSTMLFWEQGYHGSSMQAIFNATGLKPGSIYLAFGNKDGLFQATLEQYTHQLLTKFRNVLDTADSAGSGICQLLYDIIEECEQYHYCSCFLIKSQMELAYYDNALCQLASEQLQKIEALFKQALSTEYGSKASEYHAQLMMQIFGLRIYGYTQRNRLQLQQAVRQNLPWLPWQSH